MDGIHRNLGALEARADSQEARLRRIESKLDELMDTVAQSRGGWRMLSVLISVSSGISGLIGAVVARVTSWGQP